MNKTDMFSQLLNNLKIDLKQAKKISYHYRKITKSLNLKFRGTDSCIANRLKVGSIGRHSAIKGISDLDMLYIMPAGLYDTYNRMENGQSALLSDVRNKLAIEYPDQDVRKDRLVVQVVFKHFQVEVQPVFKQQDGSFKYPESYYGGSWKITKPSEEIAAMSEFTNNKSKNLRHLCKMARAWKNKHGVNMGGLLIDTLAHRFLSSTDEYDSAGKGSFGLLSRDFFLFLSNEERKEKYQALGSKQHVKVKSPWFGRAATTAYTLCCEAIDAEGFASEHDKWRKVFGRAFPRKPVIAQEARAGLNSFSADTAQWKDTEEFIEERYPVDIKYHIEMDCTVTQDGFRAQSLRGMLSHRFRLAAKKGLLFKIDEATLSLPQPYDIYWKVLNVGPVAQQKNMVRGQIEKDSGRLSKQEHTSFQGDHIVECYLVMNDVVVARAQIEVPIE
ncbi:nucleotide-binding domain-containing protein [Yersinia kristensenii]|uniref:nucleotide-binding domain-containing protein n=1 Tax=Yersinia kristensenii TaxID=28152 RepID=UPI003896940D